MVVATLDFGHYGGSKGKRGQDDQEMRGNSNSTDSRRIRHHNEVEGLGH